MDDLYEDLELTTEQADTADVDHQPSPKRTGDSPGKPKVPGAARGKKQASNILAKITGRFVVGDARQTVVILDKGKQDGVRAGMKVQLGEPGNYSQIFGTVEVPHSDRCEVRVSDTQQNTQAYSTAVINPR